MLTLFLLGCLAVAQCAPTEQAAEPAPSSPDEFSSLKATDAKHLQQPRKYLFLDPEAQQSQSAIQNPVFQPLVMLGSGKMRGKLRQLCDRMQDGIGGLPDSFLGNLFVIGDPEDIHDEGYDDDEQPAKQRVPEINTDAETIPDSIVPQGKAPQTPVEHPVVREHRFYTIAGPPQFFGNVDILQDPYHPIFSIQPLQAIRMKTTAEPINSIPSQNSNARNPLFDNEISQKTNAIDTTAIQNDKRKEKKPSKTNTKVPEWDSPEIINKSAEGVESKESAEIDSKNIPESFANRLNVNWHQGATVTTTAEKSGLK